MFLLAGVCGPVNEIVQNNTTVQMNQSVINETIDNTSTGETQISPEDLARWERIDKQSVENACITGVKEEAGANAWAIKDCNCNETLSEGQKQYDCDIVTLDPSGKRYFLLVDCTLSLVSCTIQSNYGTQTLAFQELEQRYG